MFVSRSVNASNSLHLLEKYGFRISWTRSGVCVFMPDGCVGEAIYIGIWPEFLDVFIGGLQHQADDGDFLQILRTAPDIGRDSIIATLEEQLPIDIVATIIVYIAVPEAVYVGLLSGLEALFRRSR